MTTKPSECGLFITPPRMVPGSMCHAYPGNAVCKLLCTPCLTRGGPWQAAQAALEALADAAGTRLRKPDRKAGRAAVASHTQALGAELARESDPAAALSLAVPLLVAQVGCPLPPVPFCIASLSSAGTLRALAEGCDVPPYILGIALPRQGLWSSLIF